MLGNMKKFVEKASKKHLGLGGVTDGGANVLRSEDVHPRLAFHYGVPSGSSSLAYDAINHILAVSTRNGHIKLFGMDNTQTLLQSDAAVPSKFLHFFNDQGILINVTVQNNIEVWDIEKNELCFVHIYRGEITAFSLLQHTPYMFTGDRMGNVSVLKLERDLNNLIPMPYKIPLKECRGTSEGAQDVSVLYILPQPTAESRRVLIIHMDGVIVLWGILENRVLFSTGGNPTHSAHNERKVVSSCWTCSLGSKVAVGYSSGEIFIWSIPVNMDQQNKKEQCTPNIPLLKLNLGYKMEKVPIISLKWVAGDGRGSRLYVNGFSDVASTHSFQIILLNEYTESRMTRLVLPLSESCLAMENISCFGERNRSKQNTLVLLLKSGHLCLYDNAQIEHYLSQGQSKSPPIPSPLTVTLHFGDSNITVAKFYMSNSDFSITADEDSSSFVGKYPCILSVDAKEKERCRVLRSSGLAKTNNLYITGHQDGTINFWDASCPLLLLISTIKQQGEAGNSPNGASITALHFDVSSQILFSGNRNGIVQIITFKREQSSSDSMFSFLQAKLGSNYTIQTVKLNGFIQTISVSADLKHLAVGTDKGYVSMVNVETTSVLYQKRFSCQQYSGIVSLSFGCCTQNGFVKNALWVGLEDSSVLALEEETGNALSTSPIHPKNPTRALFLHVLGASLSECSDIGSDNLTKDTASKQPLLLVCSEKDARIYSSSHAIQGIKKLITKKMLNGTCSAASLFFGPSCEIGVILVFATGKIEIRSLPDLNLLKEASIRAFSSSCLRPQMNSSSVFCASSEGDVVAVNGDQEIIFFSVLVRDIYRYLEDINLVYKKNIMKGGVSNVANDHSEKKKSIFGMVVKDMKGNKPKNNEETDAKDSIAMMSELSAIFSTSNFLLDNENRMSPVRNDDHELDIDDIDLDDTKEKHKGQNFVVLNKQMFGKKLQAIKGKLIPKMEEKANIAKRENENEKAVGSLDQIKQKYGYATNQASISKIAENRIKENLGKLQNIGAQTNEMQGTAQSFSSMARELLRTTQK